MSKAAASGGAAGDAEVVTDAQPEPDQTVLMREAVAADEAVALIEAKLTGWQASLADAKAAAKAARARLSGRGH
jgi:hypothetical protein